jgi:hypothetical protein
LSILWQATCEKVPSNYGSIFRDCSQALPNWESAVREAIEESFAFLLIASPDSRRSPYVRSELLLAQARELPIYALWAAGESWIDSIPMSLAHIQYLDFRDRAYADGLHTLIEELPGSVPRSQNISYINRSIKDLPIMRFAKGCPDPKYSSKRSWGLRWLPLNCGPRIAANDKTVR